MATKHPTLVQVWIAWRSAAPLSTLTMIGSTRLRPSGSWTTIAAVLPSAAGRTTTDTSNCRDLAVEDLLHRAAVQRLAVAAAFDPPRGDLGVGGRCRRRLGARRGRAGACQQRGRHDDALA